MSIEYQPPALERVINGPMAEKRLKNREGVAVYQIPGQKEKIPLHEGRILDVHQTAVLFHQDNPDHHIIVEEFSCGSLIVAPDNTTR